MVAKGRPCDFRVHFSKGRNQANDGEQELYYLELRRPFTSWSDVSRFSTENNIMYEWNNLRREEFQPVIERLKARVLFQFCGEDAEFIEWMPL